LDLSDKNAGIADNDAPGLQYQCNVQTFQAFDDRPGVFLRLRRSFIVIIDAEPPAQIEITNLRALFF
jgi:hypothetical protein